MTKADDKLVGPFYHGTKADLKPGDLITPGHRSNYGHSKRTSPWVYMSATLSGWGAELAQGDGPGRIYIVEPTGPFIDDPDLTDKKFPGNPTKSYRSRDPLRVVGEVVDWVPHSPEEIQAMKAGQARQYALQAARVAHIPSKADFDAIYAQASELAGAGMSESKGMGGMHLMRIRGAEVEVFAGLAFRSERDGQTRIIELPRPLAAPLSWPERDLPLSGKISEVSAWQEGWVAVIESCVTEIGLSVEARLWVAVDAEHDTLSFSLEADGPTRSWQRNLRLVRGVLADDEHGEIWDFMRNPLAG